MKKLILSAVTKYLAGIIMVMLLLFLPAGTVHYFGAWLFIALLFIPMFFLGLVLLKKAPELLEKRLQSKEKQGEQKKVVAAAALIFLLGFILSALDFRFSISNMPRIVSFIAGGVLLLSYGMYAEVMRENAYLSRTVEVQENQKVIDTGLYGVVRHPMYFSTVLLFLSIPLVLGSYIGFALFLIYPLVLTKRIKAEEELLKDQLPGYLEYTKKVRWRMLPFIY